MDAATGAMAAIRPDNSQANLYDINPPFDIPVA